MNKKIFTGAGIGTTVAVVVFALAFFGLQGAQGGRTDATVNFTWDDAEVSSESPASGKVNDGRATTGNIPRAPNLQPPREILIANPYGQVQEPKMAKPPLAQPPRDVLIVSAAPEPTPTPAPKNKDKDRVTTFSYDIAREKWVSSTQLMDPQNPQTRNNTIVVRLENDNPVKEIVIDEAIIALGSAPLLVIDGHYDATATGKIHIGVLAFKQVDAAELEIQADVVRVQLQNVVARDDELRLELRPVNVVRIGRGGATSLFLGRDFEAEVKESDDEKKDRKQKTVTGLRVDRVVIKGPQAGIGFVETIIIKRTGVFGKIDVRNVAIQDLILQDVSLDDNINRPSPTATPSATLTPLAR